MRDVYSTGKYIYTHLFLLVTNISTLIILEFPNLTCILPHMQTIYAGMGHPALSVDTMAMPTFKEAPTETGRTRSLRTRETWHSSHNKAYKSNHLLDNQKLTVQHFLHTLREMMQAQDPGHA